jgi:hypothetical protein
MNNLARTENETRNHWHLSFDNSRAVARDAVDDLIRHEGTVPPSSAKGARSDLSYCAAAERESQASTKLSTPRATQRNQALALYSVLCLTRLVDNFAAIELGTEPSTLLHFFFSPSTSSPTHHLPIERRRAASNP